MAEYYKAVKFENFIIFSSELLETELKEFEENSEVFKIIGNQSPYNIRFNNGRYSLYEWKEYQIVGTDHAPLVPEDFIHFGKLGNHNTGTIQFKNFVGISKFRNQLFDIDSEKMDSNELDTLISYVDERVKTTISLNFNAHGVSRAEYQKSQERFQDYYVYQKLYNILQDDRIMPYLKRIQKYPNVNFLKKKRALNTSIVQDISKDSLIDIASGESTFIASDNPVLRNKFKNSFVPETINEYYNQISIDTNENRFIKFFIGYCIRLLSKFIALLTDDQDNIHTSNALLIKNLYLYRNEFQKSLNSQFFKDISSIDSINYSSTTLTKQFGYKQIYNEYVNLKQTPINLFDTKSLIDLFENKSIDKLYEYICLFRLVDIIESIYLSQSVETIKISNSKTNIFTVGLSEENNGIEFLFKRDNNFPQSKLLFQHSFSSLNKQSYSVEFKPDFTFQIFKGESVINYHFDAKFRVAKDTSSKQDDIVKMHSYRDGIRNSIGAFVLYPGNKSVFYNDENKEPFSGVGSFPLNFNNEHDTDIQNVLLKCLTDANN